MNRAEWLAGVRREEETMLQHIVGRTVKGVYVNANKDWIEVEFTDGSMVYFARSESVLRPLPEVAA